MRALVDEHRCFGHAQCWTACPDVFDIDETTGRAVVLHETIPAQLVEQVRWAARGCPEQAIVLKED